MICIAWSTVIHDSKDEAAIKDDARCRYGPYILFKRRPAYNGSYQLRILSGRIPSENRTSHK